MKIYGNLEKVDKSKSGQNRKDLSEVIDKAIEHKELNKPDDAREHKKIEITITLSLAF